MIWAAKKPSCRARDHSLLQLCWAHCTNTSARSISCIPIRYPQARSSEGGLEGRCAMIYEALYKAVLVAPVGLQSTRIVRCTS